MQTHFSQKQLANPETARAERALRKCVHCGFCATTCPTFDLLGDELDSPRGRIYLMKDMLETDKPASPTVVKHLDRCLSCLSCSTTCPSGVNYGQLIDTARAHIEATYRRPPGERLLRGLIAAVLPYPRRMRAALALAPLARPFVRWLPDRLAGMLALAPASPLPTPLYAAPLPHGPPRGRVALLEGCAQSVLAPGINDAAAALLAQQGYGVVRMPGQSCCGALVQHMGRPDAARSHARRLIDQLWPLIDSADGLHALVFTTTGCGPAIRDYGHLLEGDAAYADKARTLAGLARDVSQMVEGDGLGSSPSAGPLSGLRIAYHPACSLQHGLQMRGGVEALLRAAGAQVLLPDRAHLCCGSAGSYNLLQPEIAGQLGDAKAAALRPLEADVLVTGNIGCMVQLAERVSPMPVVHTAEMLAWAAGGPRPAALGGSSGR